MTTDKDSLIENMRYNIREKQRYIEVLEEELYQIKRVLRDGIQQMKERRESHE